MASESPPGKRARHDDATASDATTAAAALNNDKSFQERLGRRGTSVRRVRDANDGKCTLVAAKSVRKGETIVAEPPLAAVQALANRGRFLACAHCMAPAGDDPARHLALAAGRVSRHDLVAAAAEAERRGADVHLPGVPRLPILTRRDTSTTSEGPTPCHRARGGCAEVFCGVACRDAASGWHALTCIGGCGEGSPIFEFRAHAKRTHEFFLLAADALARAIAGGGGSDGVVEGATDSGATQENNQARLENHQSVLSTSLSLFSGLPVPTTRWWESDGSSGKATPSDPKETAAKTARKHARRSETLLEQIQDAHQLLFMAWGLARGLRGDSRFDELLLFHTFERLVSSVDRSSQPLADDHPGVTYAKAAGTATPADAKKACVALRSAAREAVEAELGAGDVSGESDDESEDVSDDDTSDDKSGDGSDGDSEDEASDEASESEPEKAEVVASPEKETVVVATVAAVPATTFSGDDDILDAVEIATTAFPRLAALALAPAASLAGHSCLPNAQVEIARGEEDESNGSVCGGLRVSLVALRDVEAGEEITVARVSVSRPVAERHEELISRFGFDEACACVRCVYELAGDVGATALTARDFCALADQASEEGRYEDAHTCALHATRLDPKNTTMARHKGGVALLGLGKWAEAHTAWQTAFALCPENQTLAEQARKDAAYAIDASLFTETGTTNLVPLRPSELHKAGVFATHADDSPFLSKKECGDWIRHAEAAAATSGGWTTSRHYAVPTTDLPVHSVPELLPLWNKFVTTQLGPFLYACFPDIVKRNGANVRVHDAFVVRYDANAQRFLPTHVDQSSISITLALNGADAYEGGGTAFPSPIEVIARPDTGHLVAFRGDLKHAGAPVTKGTRYIVAAFLFTV